ncbi:hypothetical protein QUF74_02780 [Candidatus Halobeggiatoa sp. HSG11]|nr:hypothetical protein [Candidatus Halobeggiatoa sp. HSG11]
MQIIEFTTKIQDGIIHVPKNHEDWFEKSVKIILLEQEPPNILSTEPDAWLGCMSDTGEIIGDIVSPIGDNLDYWEVLAK